MVKSPQPRCSRDRIVLATPITRSTRGRKTGIYKQQQYRKGNTPKNIPPSHKASTDTTRHNTAHDTIQQNKAPASNDEYIPKTLYKVQQYPGIWRTVCGTHNRGITTYTCPSLKRVSSSFLSPTWGRVRWDRGFQLKEGGFGLKPTCCGMYT